MNHREPPQLPVGVRKTLRCLSLLLVPALTLEQGHAGPRLAVPIGRSGLPAPYLPVLGATSLRIEEAPPPPDLVTRPAASAPPVPALSSMESAVAAANADAARATAVPPEEPAEVKSGATATAPAPDTKSVPRILPDTTRPVVHPEDFLPYFQIPGTAQQPSQVNVIVPGVPSAPTPPPLTPSSATYTQTPR